MLSDLCYLSLQMLRLPCPSNPAVFLVSERYTIDTAFADCAVRSPDEAPVWCVCSASQSLYTLRPGKSWTIRAHCIAHSFSQDLACMHPARDPVCELAHAILRPHPCPM